MSRILVILLTLLQLVAPLVHAHTGKHDPYEGFHIPQLEFFNAEDEQAVHYGAISHIQSDGMIIDVCSGLKFNNISLDSTEKNCIVSVEKYFSDHKILALVNFSPHITVSVRQIIHSPNSPRAPPA